MQYKFKTFVCLLWTLWIVYLLDCIFFSYRMDPLKTLETFEYLAELLVRVLKRSEKTFLSSS